MAFKTRNSKLRKARARGENANFSITDSTDQNSRDVEVRRQISRATPFIYSKTLLFSSAANNRGQRTMATSPYQGDLR